MKTAVIQNPKSKIQNASRYLVGGVNSPVRAFRQVGGDPIFLIDGAGVEVRDARGRAYVDFIMGWGALLLGHRHPAVERAVRQRAKETLLLGLTHPDEVELARLIAEAVPSVEQLRLTVSGTEACLTAARLARAVTGRAKLILCDGCYHGHGESFLAGKSAGVPMSLQRETLRVPFNDLSALERLIQREGAEQVAAVFVEPVAANMGVVMPEPGYLAALRHLTSRCGILLIFDEVVTGFRVARAGAQGYFGVTPDLTTFGKIIGGGLPIGALGGPRPLMQRLAPEGDVYHAGTFAGHPLSMAAGIATLRALRLDPPYARLERLSERLLEGLVRSASRCNVAVQINRRGSMLTVFFSETPIRNATQAAAARRDQFARWAQTLRRQGILIPPSPLEALFLSTAHTEAHIDQFVHAAQTAFRSIRRGSG